MFVPYIGDDKLDRFEEMLINKLPKIWRNIIHKTGDKMRGFSLEPILKTINVILHL